MPRPDGTLWFTGLVPAQMEHRDARHETAYARTVDGRTFELINTAETTTAHRDGRELFTAPRGLRIVTDRAGTIVSVIGMSVTAVSGTLRTPTASYDLTVAANEQLDLIDGRFVSVRQPGIIPPTT